MTRKSSTTPAPRRRSAASRPVRLAVALIVSTLLLTPLGIYLYQHRPDLYDRARTDLVEAGRELDIYSQEMVRLAEQDREGAQALKAAISSLRDAAASDPADLAEINAITLALKEWEDPARAGELSAQELRDSYRLLAARVQRLIDKRDGTTQSHRR